MAVDFAEGDTLCYALIVHSDFNEENNGYGTIDVRYGEVYDYGDIAGLPGEGVAMPWELGYEQYAWLEAWGLTEEDLEKAPGHEVPVSKENLGLSTSG